MYIFDSSFKVRKALIKIVENKYFDWFILAIIIANSVTLCLHDYHDRIFVSDYKSKHNDEIKIVEYVFSAIYIIECILKIIAKGFLFHKNSYLRGDFWNVLDFFIVLISIIDFIPQVNLKSIKVLRVFRMFRPLRTFNKLPMMKELIETMIRAIPGLF